MERSTGLAAAGARARSRAGAALRHPPNWVQLVKFCTVGAVGYLVNLAVYTLLLRGLDVHYLLAATGSFLVAVTNNYTWNRVWTFRGQRGHVAYQGLRFFVVSTIALAANLVLLYVLVRFGVDKLPAQALAIVLVTPLNFVGNKLWSFRRR
jgi:putative flippase GtrA